MKVAIIGTGRMGRGFATALAPRHEVTVGSRDPDRARKTASATGATRGSWNHVHAQHLTAPEVDGIAASVLIAGDDPQAKQTVFTLARDMGSTPSTSGPRGPPASSSAWWA